MAAQSKIEWTDSTVNFWWGCTKVGPGCDHCYAEKLDARFGPSHWGKGVERRKIKGAVTTLQKLDRRWPEFREQHGRNRRVFMQSMSDVFDLEVPVEWFAEAWGHIIMADNLNIQIVTKRISAVEKRLKEIGATAWPPHVGLMVTICNQQEADRDIPRLLALKQKFNIPWVGLSIEPLLGHVDLTRVPYFLSSPSARTINPGVCNSLTGEAASWPMGQTIDGRNIIQTSDSAKLDWIIVGGESGPGARPMHPDWARSIRDQCAAAGVPFFF